MLMVLLRHDLPDGTTHFDWMIQRPPGAPDGRPPSVPPATQAPPDRLITYRVRDRIDRPGTGPFQAERLPDHRAIYLDYQGGVSGGRGHITRVADGTAESVSERDDAIEIRGTLGPVRAVFAGVRTGSTWVFTVRQDERR